MGGGDGDLRGGVEDCAGVGEVGGREGWGVG